MKIEQQGLYLPEFEHDNCGAGFICNLNGIKSNDIIHKALDILIKLEHRGAVSSDGKTGDGAGILFDIPHEFFKKVCNFEFPEPKEYAVGMVFMPKSANQVAFCKTTFENSIRDQNLAILGWRDVPVNVAYLGKIAPESGIICM
jgi:glutamate synthase (ferredoxin)